MAYEEYEHWAATMRAAVAQLQAAFQEQGSIRACYQGEVLHVTIELPDDFTGDPDACLRAFEETYWREHGAESDGRLVFEYALA